MQAPFVSAKKKTTLQSLTKIPGVKGLYRHDNGSFYGKRKLLGVKRVAALTTADGANIHDRKLAETALKSWGEKLEKPTPEGAKQPFAEWLAKLKTLWSGKAESTVDKIDWTKRCFEMDHEANPKERQILEMPLGEIKPSELSAFFSRRSQCLGAQAFNEMSRIIKNTFELAANDDAISASPYLKVPKTIRRKKLVFAPAKVPTIEQCEKICEHVRTLRASDKAAKSADMLEFMHKAALGQAECILADWEKVNWSGGYIEVKRQKTGAYFRVPIYEHLKPFLVNMWKRQGKPKAGPLFSILSPKQALYNACRRMEFEDYSPIDFRKARITWLLRKGIPAELIAKWQGHKDNGVLIRKTYSWVISEADNEYEKAQLAKLSTPVAAKVKAKGGEKVASNEQTHRTEITVLAA